MRRCGGQKGDETAKHVETTRVPVDCSCKWLCLSNSYMYIGPKP